MRRAPAVARRTTAMLDELGVTAGPETAALLVSVRALAGSSIVGLRLMA
jgi:hypothetical protein